MLFSSSFLGVFFVEIQLTVLDFYYHTGLLQQILILHFSNTVSEAETVKEKFHQKKSRTKVKSKNFQCESKCFTQNELSTP